MVRQGRSQARHLKEAKGKVETSTSATRRRLLISGVSDRGAHVGEKKRTGLHLKGITRCLPARPLVLHPVICQEPTQQHEISQRHQVLPRCAINKCEFRTVNELHAWNKAHVVGWGTQTSTKCTRGVLLEGVDAARARALQQRGSPREVTKSV